MKELPTHLPLFPLPIVLFPYGRMPLQVFEVRYLDMIKNCMRSGQGFGVVRIESGSEVAERVPVLPQLNKVGCYAQIVDWQGLPQNRLGLTVEGERRFLVESLSMQKDGLVMADVSWMDGEIEAQDRDIEGLADLYGDLIDHALVRNLNYPADVTGAEMLINVICQLLPIDSHIKQGLLECDSLPNRADELHDIVREFGGN